jgi:seryl-tRNA synthetase
MHEPRTLLDPATDAVKKMARRGYRLDLSTLRELTERRGSAIKDLDEARAEANRLAQKCGTNTERGRALRAIIAEGQQRVRDAEEVLQAFLLDIPNLPENLCPDGDSDKFAVPVRTWGTPAGPAPDHVKIGERLGIFDFTRATKLSGPRFSVLRGVGAQLERALGYLFLDLHTRQGYTEYSLPALVTRASMTGTGQLPKFDEDLFHTSVGDRELFLIPTAEVPLVNLHAGETIPAEQLPLAYTALTGLPRGRPARRGHQLRRQVHLRHRGLAARPAALPGDLQLLGLLDLPSPPHRYPN